MALVKCRECGASVSTGAKMCPRCGYDASDSKCGSCIGFDWEEHECSYTSDKGSNSTACPHYEYDDPSDDW